MLRVRVPPPTLQLELATLKAIYLLDTAQWICYYDPCNHEARKATPPEDDYKSLAEIASAICAAVRGHWWQPAHEQEVHVLKK